MFREIQSSIREQIGAIAALGGAIVSPIFTFVSPPIALYFESMLSYHMLYFLHVHISFSSLGGHVFGSPSFSYEHLIAASSFMGVIPAIELCFPSHQRLSLPFHFSKTQSLLPPSTTNHPHPPTNKPPSNPPLLHIKTQN